MVNVSNFRIRRFCLFLVSRKAKHVNGKTPFFTLGSTRTSEVPGLYKGGFGGRGGVTSVENLNLKRCLNLVQNMTSSKIITFQLLTEKEIMRSEICICLCVKMTGIERKYNGWYCSVNSCCTLCLN